MNAAVATIDNDAVKMPLFGPTNNQSNSKDLMTCAGRRHVIVYGDIGTQRTRRLKTMIVAARNTESTRESLGQKHRQTIVFAMDDSWLGLAKATGLGFMHLGRNVNDYTIDADDAETIAMTALTKDRPSQIICLQHLMPEEVSRFLEKYLRTILGTDDMDAALCFDLLDETSGRKRHRDSRTAVSIKSLALRSKSMGTSLYASATSPSELPLEIVNQSPVVVLGRMSHDANVRAMSLIDRDLYRHAKNKAFGIRHLETGVQYFYPQDGSKYAPYYAPFPEGDVGTSGRFDRNDMTPPSEDEKDLVRRLSADRAKRAADAESSRLEDGRNAKAASKAKAVTGKKGVTNHFHRLEGGCIRTEMAARGIIDSERRQTIARILISIEDTGTIDFANTPTRTALIEKTALPSVGDAARWVNKRVHGLKGVVPQNLAGALIHLFCEEDRSEGERFMDQIAGYGDTSARVNKVVRNLRNDENATLAQRLDIVRDAWKQHLHLVRTPPREEAVIVQMRPEADRAPTIQIAACA